MRGEFTYLNTRLARISAISLWSLATLKVEKKVWKRSSGLCFTLSDVIYDKKIPTTALPVRWEYVLKPTF